VNLPGALRHVAVTRVGAVGPFGATLDEFLDWWKGGRRSLIGPLTGLKEPWLPADQGGEVPFWKPRVHLPDRKAIKLMTPRVQFGVAAALEAWGAGAAEDETITFEPSPARRGMYTGCGVPVDEEWTFREAVETSIVDEQFDMQRFGEQGQDLLNPLWLVKSLTNNVLAFAAKQLDMQGPNDNFEAGAAGPLMAVGSAARAVGTDRLQMALAGGADSLVTVEALLHFARHGLLQGDRRVVPSQGAAFVKLEPGDRGEFGVLGFASRMAALPRDAEPSCAPWPPDGVEHAIDLATADVWMQARELGVREQQATVLRGTRLPDGPGDFDLWTPLGDPGSAAGALLLAAAWALRYIDGYLQPIEIAAAGPSGEVSVLLLGSLP